MVADAHSRIQAPLLGHVSEPCALGTSNRGALPMHGPGVELYQPNTARIAVVFPAPFGPRKPVCRPGRAAKVHASNAINEPNCLVARQT